MAAEEYIARLLEIAKTRLANRPGEYEKFLAEATSESPKTTTRLKGLFTIGQYIQVMKFTYVFGDMYQFDADAIRAIDEWSERQYPPVATPLPAIASKPPAPAIEPAAEQAQAPIWHLATPDRFPGYRLALYRLLKAAHDAGKPRPTAREVLDAWKLNRPEDVASVWSRGITYRTGTGATKTADTKAIQAAIENLTNSRTSAEQSE